MDRYAPRENLIHNILAIHMGLQVSRGYLLLSTVLSPLFTGRTGSPQFRAMCCNRALFNFNARANVQFGIATLRL